MTATDELRNALIWHDYAMRYLMDGIAALFEATDFDVTPAERHKARNVAVRDMAAASRALEQARLVRTIEREDG